MKQLTAFIAFSCLVVNFASAAFVTHSAHELEDARLAVTSEVSAAESLQKPTEEPAAEEIPKDVEGHGAAMRTKAKTEAARTMREVQKAGPSMMLHVFKQDVELLLSMLMPGKRPDLTKKGLELALLLVAVIWLLLYKQFGYQPDRCVQLDRWGRIPMTPREGEACVSLTLGQPDLVLVFPSPDHDYKDNDSPVARSSLEQLMPESGKTNKAEKHFSRTHALKDKCHTDVSMGHSISRAVTKQIDKSRRGLSDVETPDAATEKDHTSIRDVRSALLQDVYQQLPEMGFDLSCFSSVDADEIVICIALHNPKTVQYLLSSHGMQLQVQKQIVEKVGIVQNPEEFESDPPYMTYSKDFSKTILGPEAEDTDFWEVFGQHGDSILSGEKRVRCIFQYLNRFIDLDYAVQQGMLVQWWPAHTTHRLAQLQHIWARWSLMRDWTCLQPAKELKDYFGVRVTFILTWNGHYCKLLLALIPVALLFKFADFIFVHVGASGFWNRGTIGGLSLAVAVWGKLATNLWTREEKYLGEAWNLKNAGAKPTKRPDFHGTKEQSEIDASKTQEHYPWWKYELRKATSMFVTVSFCVMVFGAIVFWIDLFDGNLTIPASIIQAIMIQIFTLIFNAMAESMTIAENHKYQAEFYNSYLMKMFIFQFVNQFSAFLYIAVKQQYTKNGCVDDDCLGMIRSQLPVTLCSLAAMGAVQVLIKNMQVKFALWSEARTMTQKGEKPPVYTYVEEQTKYGSYRVRDQIEVMTKLMITLGYVLIFGATAPIIIPLCFLVFIIQMRASAVLLTTAVHRTVPRNADGIGPWALIADALLRFGVFFSAYMLVQFGPLFKGTEPITKLSGFLVYIACAFLLWAGVDILCPLHPPGLAILEGRRELVAQTITKKHEDMIFGRDETVVKETKAKEDWFHEPSFSKEVNAGAWDDIPKAADDWDDCED